MHTFIDFPHLGIHLENVGKTITLFGIDIAYYGITIAIGMLAGIFVATQVAKRTGQKQDDYVDLAIFRHHFRRDRRPHLFCHLQLGHV